MSSRADKSGGAGWLDPKKHAIENEFQRVRRMAYLEALLPKKGGSILDVGCSSGFMLYPLEKRGFDCVGVEPTPSSCEYVNSRGIPCYENIRDLLKIKKFESGFDLIMHFFVADQTEDPVKFITEQLKMLKQGGKLVFELCSADDPLLSLYKIKAFEGFFWQVAVNYFFSRKSLKNFLEKFQLPFDIILDQRYDLSNHLIWSIDGLPGGMGRFTDVLTKKTEDLYRNSLIKSGNCDTLIGVIYKNR